MPNPLPRPLESYPGTLLGVHHGHQGSLTDTVGYMNYNATYDGLVIYEPEMLVVEKILRMAASGLKPGAIQTRLYAESVPSPTGKQMWQRQVLRRMVDNDIYLPRTYDEVKPLVSPELGAKLDREQSYALWWFGRQ